jgi:hypothetical protein
MRKIHGIAVLTSLLCLLPAMTLFAEAPSGTPRRIAILDIRSDGCDASLARFASERLSEKVYGTGKFTLVEREQMEVILKEQGFQQSGCTEVECAVKVGKLLSVDKMILGSLGCVDGYNLSVRMIDVESGVVDAHFSAVAREKKNLDSAAGELARKMVERYYGGGPSSLGYYMRGAVPGWSQIYAGHEVKGYSLMGAFVFSGMFMGYALYDFRQKRAEYEDLGPGTSQSVFDEKYNASEKALATARVAMGIFATVYIVHLVDMVLFSRPSVMYGTRPGVDMGDGMRVAGSFQWYDIPGSNREHRLSLHCEKRF